MNEKKIKIRIGKNYLRYNLENGATIEDINKKTLDYLAKIFDGEIISDHNSEEKESSIITELTIINGFSNNTIMNSLKK